MSESNPSLPTGLKCHICNCDLSFPIPGERAIKKFKKKTGMVFEGHVCSSCMNINAKPKKLATDSTKQHLARANSEAYEAIKSDNYELFRLAENHIEAIYQEIEEKISHAIGYIQGLNERREEVASVRDKMLAALAASPSANYFNRRAEASRAISDPALRSRIFRRDGFQCKKCGSKESLSIDHIISVKDGGHDRDSNLQCLCTPCNSSKGCKSWREITIGRWPNKAP